MIEKIVEEGYNIVSKDKYYGQGEGRDLGIFDKFMINIDKGKILELGCGSCNDVGKKLVEQGFDYTGVDISEGQLEQAKKYVDKKYLVKANMLDFVKKSEDNTYDGVVTMFADFHLPRITRVELYVNIIRSLKPRGYLLFTAPDTAWEGYIEDYVGAKMYWSTFSKDWYEITMRDLGMELIEEYFEEYEHRPPKKEKRWFLLYQKPELT